MWLLYFAAAGAAFCCFRSDTVSIQHQKKIHTHTRMNSHTFKKETGHRKITSLSGNLLPFCTRVSVCTQYVLHSKKFQTKMQRIHQKTDWNSFCLLESRTSRWYLSFTFFCEYPGLWLANTYNNHGWTNRVFAVRYRFGGWSFYLSRSTNHL